MDDKKVKKIAGMALEHKDLIFSVISRLSPEDVENGIVRLNQDIVNNDLKPFIMERFGEYIDDYTVQFDNGAIFLDCKIQAKQLGKLSCSYMLTFERFMFGRDGHIFLINYAEKILSQGNVLQNLAVKTAGLKGSYLKTVLEISKIPFISIDDSKLAVNLDKSPFASKIPTYLQLDYLECDDGDLKLEFFLI